MTIKKYIMVDKNYEEIGDKKKRNSLAINSELL